MRLLMALGVMVIVTVFGNRKFSPRTKLVLMWLSFAQFWLYLGLSLWLRTGGHVGDSWEALALAGTNIGFMWISARNTA